MLSANIHLPIPYFDEIRLNQAIDLLEKINQDASQLKELFDKKSETENSKWYREKLAKLFLSLTVLSSLSVLGLSIASKYTQGSVKDLLSDISGYTGYGTMFVTIIGVFLSISPDNLSLSIKAFFKEFTPEEIERLNKFAANLYRLQNNSKSAYYHERITELPCEYLYDISQQFQNLSLVSINTAKAYLNKLPSITNNLSLLFSKTVKDETKSHLTLTCDQLPQETYKISEDSDECIDFEDDNENESLLDSRLVIRQI